MERLRDMIACDMAGQVGEGWHGWPQQRHRGGDDHEYQERPLLPEYGRSRIVLLPDRNRIPLRHAADFNAIRKIATANAPIDRRAAPALPPSAAHLTRTAVLHGAGRCTADLHI